MLVPLKVGLAAATATIAAVEVVILQQAEPNTMSQIIMAVQTIVLAAIPVVGAIIISKQNKIQKLNEEIKLDVNSKSTKQDAIIDQLRNTPGANEKLAGIIAMLEAQNTTAATNKRDAAMDTRLAGIEAAARSAPAAAPGPVIMPIVGPAATPAMPAMPMPTALPGLSPASGAEPGTFPVTVVKQIDPVPVKVVPHDTPDT